MTTLLLLLFEQATIGLFAWGNGSLVQSDLTALTQLGPVIVGRRRRLLVLLGHRLDILALGDDTAAVLGLDVRRTRLTVTVLAVLLSAAAVTLAGPIGFVGLCAPVIVRLLAPVVPGLHRHRVLLPLSGIAGVLIVLGSDVLLRAVLGGQAGVDVPTGVVTTLLGAVVLIWLARRHRDAGPTRRPPRPARGGVRSAAFHRGVVVVACASLTAGAWLVGHARRRHLGAPRRRRQLAQRRHRARVSPSCWTSGRRASPRRCSPARRSRSPAPPCRRSAATRSPNPASSASPPAPGSARSPCSPSCRWPGSGPCPAVAGLGALLAFAAGLRRWPGGAG